MNKILIGVIIFLVLATVAYSAVRYIEVKNKAQEDTNNGFSVEEEQQLAEDGKVEKGYPSLAATT